MQVGDRPYAPTLSIHPSQLTPLNSPLTPSPSLPPFHPPSLWLLTSPSHTLTHPFPPSPTPSLPHTFPPSLPPSLPLAFNLAFSHPHPPLPSLTLPPSLAPSLPLAINLAFSHPHPHPPSLTPSLPPSHLPSLWPLTLPAAAATDYL